MTLKEREKPKSAARCACTFAFVSLPSFVGNQSVCWKSGASHVVCVEDQRRFITGL